MTRGARIGKQTPQAWERDDAPSEGRGAGGLLLSQQANGALAQELTDRDASSRSQFSERFGQLWLKAKRHHVAQSPRGHNPTRALHHLSSMPVSEVSSLTLAAPRLLVHLRPLHLCPVARSHSRISAAFAFHPVTGRNQSPRLYEPSNSNVQSWFRAQVGPTNAASAVLTESVIWTGSSASTSYTICSLIPMPTTVSEVSLFIVFIVPVDRLVLAQVHPIPLV
jgi:hypothetical protein